MTVQDIVRKTPASRTGYTINSIGATTLKPEGCGFLRRLCRVPANLTAQLDRAKIDAVWKTIFGGIDVGYYIIRATDGTLFHVDF